MSEMHRISVYVDNSLVYHYYVDSPAKGREHAAAIIEAGYRHTPIGSSDLEWFPPHRIVKVKVSGGGESTQYKDETTTT